MSSLCTPLSSTIIEDYFVHHGSLIECERGETFIHAHIEPEGVHYLKNGLVKVYDITSSGQQFIRHLCKAGELFSLSWAFSENAPTAYYSSLSSVVMYRVPREKFVEFVTGNNEVSHYVFDCLVELSKIYERRIDNLSYQKAYYRVVYRLLDLADRFGMKEDQGMLVKVPLGHAEVADSIRLSRETVSRELERLSKDGLITYGHHYFTIPDVARLWRELE